MDNEGIESSVERYDPSTNTWEAVAPMSIARYTLGVASLDGKLFAVGGRTDVFVEQDDDDDDDGEDEDYNQRVDLVERYDPTTNAWEVMAPMGMKRGVTVDIIDGKLYAFSDTDSDDYPSKAERYDLASNVWEPMATMSTRRSHIRVASL